MPYTGINDADLPNSVKKLPKALRKLWVKVFNEHFDPDDEGQAYRAAWGAVRQARSAQEARKMTKTTNMPWPVGEAAKSTNLAEYVDQIRNHMRQAFPGLDLWPVEVFDDHVIVRLADDRLPIGSIAGFWKIPYTATLKSIEGDPNGQEVVEAVTFAPREQWVQMVPTFVEFKAFEQPDGRTRWMTLSSGGFEDRDREVVSTFFLRSAVAAAKELQVHGPLLIWHVPGAAVGTCDTQVVIGQPGFLVESGLFDDTPDGRKAAAYYREHAKEYGCSIRFLYARRTGDGIYLPPGLIVERSLLPRERAAFPWSGITVEGVSDMSKQVHDDARAELAKVLGDERAKEIVDQLTMGSRTLKELGVRFKELAPADNAEPTGAVENESADSVSAGATGGTVEATATKADTGDELSEFSVVLSPEAVTAVAKEVRTGLNTDLATLLQGLTDGLQEMKAALTNLSAGMDRLSQAEEERIAEKVANLPRATVRRIMRPTQQPAVEPTSASESLMDVGKHSLYGDK